MNQVWNIFRKDIRHHWPEIAASLALLAAFAWLDIRSWGYPDWLAAAGGFSFLFASQLLPGLVNALYPLSWIFLIVRVVQAESLVGDRQFWVTRPYDWKQLLAAKGLFVLVFVNLPLFCMDAFLLARAGFHPAHYIGGLLWMQLMWILFLFLSAAAVASVTKNVPQTLLAALLIALYMVGMAALSQVVPNSGFSARGDESSGLLLIGTAVMMVVLQYSRRRTALSRWLIVGLCAAMTLIMVVTPYRSLIAREYPLSKGELPVQLALMSPEKGDGSYRARSDVGISFPLRVSDVPADSFLELDGMVVTLTNSVGVRWNSGWQGQYQYLFPDVSTIRINFDVKQKTFDQFKSGPVNVGLLLAFTLYHDQDKRQFVVPNGEFNLPDIGLCSSEMQYWNGLRCREPLRGPAFLLVTSEPAVSTCPLKKGETRPGPGHFARGSLRGSDEPAEMGISPIREVNVYVTDWDNSENRLYTPGVCPGTSLILSNPVSVEHRRLELQFDNLSLRDYAQSSGGATGVALHL